MVQFRVHARFTRPRETLGGIKLPELWGCNRVEALSNQLESRHPICRPTNRLVRWLGRYVASRPEVHLQQEPRASSPTAAHQIILYHIHCTVTYRLEGSPKK